MTTMDFKFPTGISPGMRQNQNRHFMVQSLVFSLLKVLDFWAPFPASWELLQRLSAKISKSGIVSPHYNLHVYLKVSYPTPPSPLHFKKN